jgi:hypothetical protein
MQRTYQLIAPVGATLAVLATLSATAGQSSNPSPSVPINREREAYYGDLHLHTSYSFDAYQFGTGVDPAEAYRFAKGEVVPYLGQPVQRREPLDFMAVTDHSECLGIFNELEDPNSIVSQSAVGKAFKALKAEMGSQLEPNGHPPTQDAMAREGKFYEDYLLSKSKLPNNLRTVSGSAWQREVDFANRNYEPGKFTTFIAYEWSASPSGENLHRNVFFRGDSAPYPFTSADSNKPEELWAWLERIRKQGYEALAIPHNGNASNGLMYDWVNSRGKAIDLAYAEHRQKNEPFDKAMLEAVAGSSQIIQENDIGDCHFLNERRSVNDPGEICGSHAAIDNGAGNAKAGGDDAFVPQMIGGLAREFLDDQIELREFLTGKSLLEDGSERAAFFRRKRQITLRAANISSKNHQFPPK